MHPLTDERITKLAEENTIDSNMYTVMYAVTSRSFHFLEENSVENYFCKKALRTICVDYLE